MPLPAHAAEMKTFDSLGELIDLGIDKFKGDAKARYFFRGECGIFKDSSPGIFRKDKSIENEKKIFQDALNRVPELFTNCPTTFDKLCQMAHYGFLARILDVSTDLAMSWFMAADGFHAKDLLWNVNNTGGSYYCPCVLVFRVPEDRKRFVDSDLVATLSSAARMKNKFNSGELAYEVKQDRAGYEEEYLLDGLRRGDFSKNYLAYPRMSNPRVRRQKGAFILCGMTQENCGQLARGQSAQAEKSKKDPGTGLCYPKLKWNPSDDSEDIAICARFVPSQKYFQKISEAVAAGWRTYREITRIQDAVDKFKRKVFDELAFVGGGESDAYADDYKRQAESCNAIFSK